VAEYHIRGMQYGISKSPESAFNTLPAGAATNWLSAVTTNPQLVVPNIEKITDEGKTGNGNEFPTVARNNYWSQPEFSIADELNTDIFAVLLRRAMGATATVAQVAASAQYEHSMTMQLDSSGLQLPSSSLAVLAGSNDMVLGGCVVNSIAVEQQGANPATFTAALVGSGHWKRSSTIASFALPAMLAQNYMHGAQTVMNFNDGTSLDLSARVRNLSVALNNNLRRDDRRPGDPFITAGDPTSGAYTARMTRGPRSVNAQVTVLLDSITREFDAHRLNTILTSVTFKFVGYQITGEAAKYHEVELVIPKAYVRNIGGGQDNDLDTLTLDFLALKDTVTSGLMTAKVRNAQTTAIS
jgi:hypothetical protein